MPLESDSSVMNTLVEKMGFDTSLYEFTDILSIELGDIKMIPQPVAAVMMLYQLTDVQKEYHQNEQVTPTKDKVWFIKECVEYTCRTIGLLHALLNAPQGVRTNAIRTNSWLHSFYNYCPVAMGPNATADVFEGDCTIKMLHNNAASNLEGNAASESLTDEIIGHFIAMVHINRGLYELDGQKYGPVQHGDTTQETLLEDACKVVEKFMKHDPNEWHFSIMALVPKKD